LLAGLWDVPPLDENAPQVVKLGADVPVCLRAPAPARMLGIGDMLHDVPTLPACAIVLVRPPVDVPTGQVFAGLATKKGTPMADVPAGLAFAGFVLWLAAQRNDLQAPAMQIAPQIATLIAHLKTQPAVGFAGMSGSGATCFAIVEKLGQAQAIAAGLRTSHPDHWVAAANML
jgi:4-diphosphocytidyl-2-C-methyl-D-erythritol kinase